MAAFAIILIAGCGAGTRVASTTVATVSNWITTTSPSQSATTADKYDSAHYCQQLQSGVWVTNDTADSTTPCVPDPRYATGDEEADASQAIPRCYTCTLSEWKRAEQRKARQAPEPSGGTPDAHAIDRDGWSSLDHEHVVETCASSWRESEGLCDCIANKVAQAMPAYEAAEVGAHDPRVQAAAEDCDPDSGEP
jgi:hypothetical protein